MTHVEGSGTLTIRKPKVLTWEVLGWFDRENSAEMGLGLFALFQAPPRVHTAKFVGSFVHSHRFPVMS